MIVILLPPYWINGILYNLRPTTISVLSTEFPNWWHWALNSHFQSRSHRPWQVRRTADPLDALCTSISPTDLAWDYPLITSLDWSPMMTQTHSPQYSNLHLKFFYLHSQFHNVCQPHWKRQKEPWSNVQPTQPHTESIGTRETTHPQGFTGHHHSLGYCFWNIRCLSRNAHAMPVSYDLVIDRAGHFYSVVGADCE